MRMRAGMINSCFFMEPKDEIEDNGVSTASNNNEEDNNEEDNGDEDNDEISDMEEPSGNIRKRKVPRILISSDEDDDA